jgi:hypothetical protein
MKLFRQILPVVALAGSFAVSAKADLVIANPAGAVFTALGASGTFTNSGTPFFDNNSDDSTDVSDATRCNIGSLLSGQTAIATCFDAANRAGMNNLAIGSGNYEYLNDGAGGNVNSFKLQSSQGFGEITLQLELAGARATNEFKIINLTTGNDVVHFIGSDASGSIKGFANLNVGDEYAFWFKNNLNGISQSNTNASRFALFRVGGGSGMNLSSFLVGIEDGTDNDFQDMILTANVVPEPASVVILSSAVIGTLALVRRRQQAKK